MDAALFAAVPLVIVLVVALVVVVFVVSLRRARERRAAVRAWASAHEADYLPTDPRLVRRFDGAPFGRGHGRAAGNVVHGRHDGRAFAAFDYSYRTSGSGRGEGDDTHRFSVLALALGVAVPGLSVTRQGVLGRLVGRVFGTDLVIGDPAFDDAFGISTDAPGFARDVLHPGLRQVLTSAPHDLEVRFTGDSLLLVRPGLPPPAELDDRLALAAAVLTQVPESVWATLREPPR